MVFVVKGDDSDCVGSTKMLTTNRVKTIDFIIKPSISYKEYITAVFITIGCIIFLYIVLILTFCWCSMKDLKPRAMDYVDHNDCQAVQEVTTPSTAVGNNDHWLLNIKSK